jgi:hypothetical protein
MLLEKLPLELVQQIDDDSENVIALLRVNSK